MGEAFGRLHDNPPPKVQHIESRRFMRLATAHFFMRRVMNIINVNADMYKKSYSLMLSPPFGGEEAIVQQPLERILS